MPNKTTKLFPDKPEWNIISTNDDVVTKVTKNKYWQTKTLFCRTYMALDDLCDFLRDTHAMAWAYIVHDKDVNEDGTPKQPHIHFVAKWEDGIRLSYLGKHTRGQQTHVDVCKHGTKASVAYLTHKKQPTKHQYNDTDVVSFNIDVLLETKKQRKEKDNECFLDDLVALSMRELAVKYGRDLMKNFKSYQEFICDMNVQEADKDLENIENELSNKQVFDYYGVSWDNYVKAYNASLATYLVEAIADSECIVDSKHLHALIYGYAKYAKLERDIYLKTHKYEIRDAFNDDSEVY